MINLTEELAPLAGPGMHLPAATLDPSLIRAVMINEVVPEHPEDDFYGANDPPFYLTTALPLFQRAGLPAQSIRDVTDAGVYITNAVKTPKKTRTCRQRTSPCPCLCWNMNWTCFPA